MQLRGRMIAFVVLAVVLSWTCWLPLAARRWGLAAWGPEALHLIGSLGPAAAALVVAALAPPPGPRALFAGLSPTRMTWLGWFLGLGAPLGLLAIGAVSQAALGEGALRWPDVLRSEAFPALSSMALVAAQIVFFGLGEELGWRGYAFPLLCRRMPPLWASVLLAAPWAIWHLPLLVSNPTYRDLGAAGLLGWFFSLLSGSVLMGWAYLRTGGALLAIVLFHGLLDLVMVNPAITGSGTMAIGAVVTLAGMAAAADLYARPSAA